MITRLFQDVLDRIIDNAKSLFLAIVLFFFILTGFYLIFSNDMCVKLFYLDKGSNKLAFEYRQVAGSSKRELKIKNVVDDLLLGPVNIKLKNQFDSNAKLLSVSLVGDDVYLNFTNNTFKSVENPQLCIQSIVETVSFFDNSAKRVFIFVEGVNHRYIGDVGPIDVGVVSNYNFLSK